MRYFLFFLQLLFYFTSIGQNLSSVISSFNQDSLIKTVRDLSGEDSVIINGSKTIIKYRAAYMGFNLTENYLIEKLSRFNLNVETYKYSINGLNIFATQKGTKYPGETFIVGAHHDGTDKYSADDNASGVAAVMETARILSGIALDYSVIYALWDEEEAGLWGSSYHARQVKANGQTFKGIINLDMIGYDSNNDKKFDIHINQYPSSSCFADSIVNIIKRYNLQLDPQIFYPGTDRGDHYSYWKQGIYNAIGIGERIFSDDGNPAYHTDDDRINLFNIPYFAEISKMTAILMATLAQPSVTAISDITELSGDAVIYPNPTNGLITIDMKNTSETTVIISDITGRILFKKDYRQPLLTVDLKNFTDGIYMVTLINKNGNLTRKVVKTN